MRDFGFTGLVWSMQWSACRRDPQVKLQSCCLYIVSGFNNFKFNTRAKSPDGGFDLLPVLYLIVLSLALSLSLSRFPLPQ